MIKNPEELHLPFPIITPRLKIVPVLAEHAEELNQAKLDSIESLKEWMEWAYQKPDLEKDREMCATRKTDFDARTDMMLFAFTHQGRLVVSTGFHRFKWAIPRCEIGFWCRKTDEGKGYVTESTNAMTRYAFDVMKMRKVTIEMDTENPKSEAVAKRLGFRHEFDDIGGMTKPGSTNLRVKRVYSAFDTKSLPALDVSWG